MNKLLSTAVLAMAFILVTVLSCARADTEPPAKLDTIRLVGTIGPLSIPLAYMAENDSLAEIANETTLSIWANPTQLQAIVAGEQGDFVSLPTNSAAIFYNRGVPLQLLDSSIWNILYLITPDTGITSAAGLRGKRVVVPYQGAVPDALFRFVLQQQGINPDTDIEIFYAPDPVQASQLLLSGQEQYVLLSEPSATSAIARGQNSGMTFVRALNMENEWQKATGGETSTPVAGAVGMGSPREKPGFINTFLTEDRGGVRGVLDNPGGAGDVGGRGRAGEGV